MGLRGTCADLLGLFGGLSELIHESAWNGAGQSQLSAYYRECIKDRVQAVIAVSRKCLFAMSVILALSFWNSELFDTLSHVRLSSSQCFPESRTVKGSCGNAQTLCLPARPALTSLWNGTFPSAPSFCPAVAWFSCLPPSLCPEPTWHRGCLL